MGKKKDIRSVQTEDLLIRCLSQLLTQKELKKITVSELTRLAGIHRATFYDHFTDVFDLYDKMMLAFFDELENTMKDDSIVTYSDFYNAIVDLLFKDKNLGRLALSEPKILSRAESFFIKSCIDTWREEMRLQEITPEIEYAASFRVNGCIGILKSGINSDHEYPIQELKDYIARLDEKTDSAIKEFLCFAQNTGNTRPSFL